MENRSMFVGLDVHKETIDVSIAEGDRHGEVRHYTPLDSKKAFRVDRKRPNSTAVNSAKRFALTSGSRLIQNRFAELSHMVRKSDIPCS